MSMTNEQINALTDPQINVMMIEHVYGMKCDEFSQDWDEIPYIYSENNQVFKFIDEPQSGSWTSVNYCNDPAAMIPIVFSEGIGLYPERLGDSAVWVAAKSIYKANNFRHTNPLRAAAIVYLKSKGVL